MNDHANVEKLKAHVFMLADEIGERNVFKPQALQVAADYISAQWREQGYQLKTYSYEVRGIECANIEVTRLGSKRPNEYLLVGAHYDSVSGSPGANDNGSAVASMLELSRLFSQCTPDISVRFVAFVNEEPPFFMWNEMGSMIYAKMARGRGDKIRAMVSLETIGCFLKEAGSQYYPPLFRLF